MPSTPASISSSPNKAAASFLVFTDGVDRPLDFEKKSKSLKDVMKRAEEKD